MAENNLSRLQKQALWQLYPDLYEQVLAVLARHDPICICADERPAAYIPEVNTILPRLQEATSAADMLRIVREEMILWFDEAAVRGSYAAAIGDEIWGFIQQAAVQDQIRTIRRDLPHLVVSGIANLLVQHEDISPAEYESIAQALRSKAERLEQRALALRRRAKSGNRPSK